MTNKEIETWIENDDALYYWAYSWVKSYHKNINSFIKENRAEIKEYIKSKKV